MVKEWFATPQDVTTPEESNCQATYLLESGKLLMPCVDVVDSSDQVESHEVVMRQVESTLVELPKWVVTEVDNKEYIITDSQSITVEKSLRSNCTYKISSTNRYFFTEGGSGSINVSTSANCRWSASSGVKWVTITSGNGAGTGTVRYRVSRNDGDIKRLGKLTVVGKTLTITQEGFCDTVPFSDMVAIMFVTRCG